MLYLNVNSLAKVDDNQNNNNNKQPVQDLYYSNYNDEKLMCNQIVDIFFDKSYQPSDIFIIAGLILILLGLGSILVEVCAFVRNDHYYELNALVGIPMLGLGLIFCLIRSLIQHPRILNQVCTFKWLNSKMFNPKFRCLQRKNKISSRIDIIPKLKIDKAPDEPLKKSFENTENNNNWIYANLDVNQ